MKNLVLPSYIQIIIILLIGLILFVQNRKKNIDGFLDFDLTDSIRGFSILLIIIHHIDRFRLEDPNQLGLFYHLGSVGVGIFLTLSGYGLMESYQRKKNLDHYFSHKFLRVFIPYIIINNLILLYDILIAGKSYSATDTIMYSLGILNSTDQNFWYIRFLLFNYICFFLIVYLAKSQREIIILFIGLGLFVLFSDYPGYTARINAFSFTLGLLLSCYKDHIKNLLKKRDLLFMIPATILFIGLVFIVQENIHKPVLGRLNYLIGLSLCIIPFCLIKTIPIKEKIYYSIFALLVSSIFFSSDSITYYSWAFLHVSITLGIIFLSKYLYTKSYPVVYKKLGEISYELYLIHGFFMYKYDFILSATSPIYSIPLYLISIILLAWLLNIFFNFIIERLRLLIN